jgi:hypothetical protein
MPQLTFLYLRRKGIPAAFEWDRPLMMRSFTCHLSYHHRTKVNAFYIYHIMSKVPERERGIDKKRQPRAVPESDVTPPNG